MAQTTSAPLAPSLTSVVSTTAPDASWFLRSWHDAKETVLENGDSWIVTGQNELWVHRAQDKGAASMRYVDLFSKSPQVSVIHGLTGDAVQVQADTSTFLYYDPESLKQLVKFWNAPSTFFGWYRPQAQEYNFQIVLKADCPTSTSLVPKNAVLQGLESVEDYYGSSGRIRKVIRQFPVQGDLAIPVKCIDDGLGNVDVIPLNGESLFRNPVVDAGGKFVTIHFLDLSFQIDLTKEPDQAVNLESSYTLKTPHIILKIPERVPYCLDASNEGGDFFRCESGKGIVETDAFAGLFTQLRSFEGEGNPSMSIIAVPSALQESGADFGKRSLQLDRQYGKFDPTNYSDEQDFLIGGEKAFSFVAHRFFEERGGEYTHEGTFKDAPEFFENAGEAEECTISKRVVYLSHDGIFYRLMFPRGDSTAEQILDTVRFTR